MVREQTSSSNRLVARLKRASLTRKFDTLGSRTNRRANRCTYAQDSCSSRSRTGSTKSSIKKNPEQPPNKL